MTEEEKIARSKRVRKASQGQYYSDFKRVDPRGKSSKVKDEMIADLQRNLKYQLIRINKLKYVIQLIKENEQYKRDLKQGKIRRRDKKVLSLKEDLHEAEKQIRSRERKIQRLLGKVDDKDSTISNLQKEIEDEHKPTYLVGELDRWKTKYDELYVRYRRVLERKRYRPVKKVVVQKEDLTDEEKKLKRLIEKPISEKEYKLESIVSKTIEFLSQSNLTINMLRVLLLANKLPKLIRKEIRLEPKSLTKMEEIGLISSQYLGGIETRKFWYITPDGKKMADEYTEYVTSRKNNLI